MTNQGVESTAVAEVNAIDPRSAPSMTRWYWAGTALLATIVLWVLIGPDLSVYLTPARANVQIDDVTYRPKASQWHEALEAALNVHTEASGDVITMLEGDLSDQISELFRSPRENVAKAADWYYSPAGVLYRTTSMLGANVAGKLSERLFPEQIWSEQQAELFAVVTNTAVQYGASVSEQVRDTFHNELESARIDRPQESEKVTLTLEFQQSEFVELLLNDPVMGQHVAAIAIGGIGSVAAERAAQMAAKRKGTAAIGGKLAVKCTVAGPVGWMCAALVFSTVMLGAEVMNMVADEIRNREDFERALHAEIDRLENVFHEAMQGAFIGGMKAQLESQRGSIESQVRPIDLILRPKS